MNAILIIVLLIVLLGIVSFLLFRSKSQTVDKATEYWKREAELTANMDKEEYQQYLRDVDDGTIKRLVDLERDPERDAWEKRNYH